MEHIKKLFSSLLKNNSDIDICDLADTLWLAKNLSANKLYQKDKDEIPPTLPETPNKDKTTPPPIPPKSPEPYNDTQTVKNKISNDYQFDSDNQSEIPLEAKLDTTVYTSFELSSQLKLLRKKIYFQSSEIIDEDKTANFIAQTKIYQPVFQQEAQKYFSLTLIIDQSTSMFLWEDIINQFLKEIKQVGIFQNLHIYYLDTTELHSKLYHDKAHLSKTSIKQEVHLHSDRNIILILSDCTSKAWKSNDVYESFLSHLTKQTFVAIMQMLPFHMWMKSTLGRGIEAQFHANYMMPTNQKLQFDKSYITELSPKALKIPIISLDKYSLYDISKVIFGKKDYWVTGVVLDEYQYTSDIKPKPKLNTKERYEYFISVASTDAQKLAIYCSVLPLTLSIVQLVQSIKGLKKDKGIISEFYFGNIIYFDQDTKQFKYYQDDTGNVREYFRNFLDTKEAFELAMTLSDEIQKSFALPVGYKELFYQTSKEHLTTLSKHEKEIIDIFIKTLNRRGGKFRQKGKEITIKISSLTSLQETKIREKLEETEICEHVGQEVYIGGTPKDGDYLSGTVSQCGDAPENIDILNIEQIENSLYKIQTRFDLNSSVEILDYPYHPLSEEKEFILDMEATIDVKFKNDDIVFLKIHNITMDNIDKDQLDYHSMAEKQEFTKYERLIQKDIKNIRECKNYIKLRDIINQVLATTKGQMNLEKDIVYQNNSKLNIYVKLPKIELHNVVNNIINNAIKYGKKGTYIKISDDINKYYYNLYIEGISYAVDAINRDRIFEKGYRAREIKKEFVESKIQNKGLGLYYAKSISKAWLGNIKLEQSMQIGETGFTKSIFIIKIPIKIVEEK